MLVLKYVAECRQCAVGTLVKRFTTEAERDAWVRYHSVALGHTVTSRDEP